MKHENQKLEASAASAARAEMPSKSCPNFSSCSSQAKSAAPTIILKITPKGIVSFVCI